MRVLQALDTVTELVQGPCPDNQMELVTHKFVEVVGSIVESGAGKGTLAGKELQQKCMLAMTSLFEGRRDRDIHHRVASLLNTQVCGHVWRMCRPMGAVYVMTSRARGCVSGYADVEGHDDISVPGFQGQAWLVLQRGVPAALQLQAGSHGRVA